MNAGLKCAARGSLEMQGPTKSPKNRHLGTIANTWIRVMFRGLALSRTTRTRSLT